MKRTSIIVLTIIIILLNFVLPLNVNATENTQNENIVNEETAENNSSQVVEDIQQNTSSFYGSDITWDWQYFDATSNFMAHALMTPSGAENYDALPAIVWLHGADVAVGGDNAGLSEPGVPHELKYYWSRYGFEGFRAYIICPRIFNPEGQFGAGGVTNLLNYYVNEFNIDAENIILIGHSLGGNSASMLSVQMSGY